ncbi:1352_t:CDS:2 [Ambispora gerdemannii]|uniref:1352_t:CDS:1 n=1 Tax=Ambispora gerdemannii TaxID=144530 RepID=A0A9N9AY78_9GLOM|nr:1352_t:CDS:2 [Ambispora gerdemannii]
METETSFPASTTTIIGASATILVALAGCSPQNGSLLLLAALRLVYYVDEEQHNFLSTDYMRYKNSHKISSENGVLRRIYYDDAAGWQKLEVPRVVNKDGHRPSNFEEIILKGYEFVDRSLFIKDCIEFNGRVALIIRPHGYGKTTNLSMLDCFFNIKPTAEPIPREEIFRDLEIWKPKNIVRQYFKKVPVIHFDMSRIKGTNWAEMYENIKRMICLVYLKHKYLPNRLEPLEDREHFEDICACDRGLTEADWEKAFRDLSSYLYKYHNQHCFVLVDNFELPAEMAYDYDLKAGKPFHKKALAFFKNMFTELLKDNPYLDKAFIVGSDISKRSYFLPAHVWEYTLSDSNSDKIFLDKFAFLDHDMQKLLRQYRLSSDDEEAVLEGGKARKVGKGTKKMQLYNPEIVWRLVSERLASSHKAKW